MQCLAIQGLSKSYQAHAVLDTISLTANNGDIITLLGHSGSGKSTLLRCLCNLEHADQGHIVLNSTTQASKAKQHPIAMVFQDYQLWPHLTVLKNLILAPMHTQKKSKTAAIKQACALLKKLRLLHKKNSYPAQLSGGEQQRVAIARALIMEPQILLLDEPSSALDPETICELLTLLKSLSTQGMTLIMATHDIGFAKRIATKVVFLHQGTILEQGTNPECFKQPKSKGFKQFLQSTHH
jgi:ABC-type polar amino acid transport system ATPase subunit